MTRFLARVLRHPIRPPSPRRLLAVILLGWLIYSVVGAIVAARWQHRAGEPLTSAGFGYGVLIDALDRTGVYRVEGVHYPGVAFSAHRLPLIPGTLMALRAVVGDDLARIGLAKALLFNALLAGMAWIVLRRVPQLTSTVVVLLILPATLPFWNLTLFEVSVEEAYLIPVLGLLLALLWFDPGVAAGRWVPALGVAGLAASLPWIKSSMPYWALATPLLLGLRTRSWHRAAASLAIVTASLVGLAAFTLHVSGRFTIKSSWEGWNLYKGNNPATAKVYPHYSLDTLDYVGVVVADRPLRDEWDHDAYFRTKAVAYIRAEPVQFLKNALRKAWVFFFEIRRTGRSDDQPENAVPLRVLQSGTLLGFRLLFWLAVVLAFRDMRRRSEPTAGNEWAVPLSFLALIGLAAGFHLVGFAYERHVMPLVLPTMLFLIWHFAARAERERMPADV